MLAALQGVQSVLAKTVTLTTSYAVHDGRPPLLKLALAGVALSLPVVLVLLWRTRRRRHTDR